MRNTEVTKEYYQTKLGFKLSGSYPDYLILNRDNIEIHFFKFADLQPEKNYGQAYIRVSEIEALYTEYMGKKDTIHPNGPLQQKPWGQKEFSVLDPDCNLLTFGEDA